MQLKASGAVEAAAANTGVDATDLAARTQMGISAEDLILTIKVAAADPSAAVDQANAVAQAGLAANTERTANSIQGATDDAKQLLSTGALSDTNAERARVLQVGESLGVRQSEILESGSVLSVVQPASLTTVTRPSPIVMGVLTSVAGLLLGVLIALGIGPRRGRIRSSTDLRRLFPRSATTSLEGVPTLLARHTGGIAELLVLDMDLLKGSAKGNGGAASNALKEELVKHGFDVAVASNAEELRRIPAGNGRPSLVLVVPSNAAELRDAVSGEGRARPTLVPLRLGGTKVSELDDFIHDIGRRELALVGISSRDVEATADSNRAH